MLATLGCLFAVPVFAQQSSPTFGGRIDYATLKTQQKVETLYEQQEYERAFFIYKNELAPIGDKYAQYMVGFMYLTGAGVREDPLMASAWFRLASERSYPQFVTVRDQLLASFSDVDLARSDEYYRQIRRKYSDLIILMKLIRDDFDSIGPRTGSRLPGSSGAVTIVNPRSGKAESSKQYEVRVQERIEDRLRVLQKMIPHATIETKLDRVDLAKLQDIVDQEIENIDSP